MAKFINPFTDVGFKKIFGQEVSKDLLIDFLNDLLVDEKSITDITFLDKEILPEYMGDRGVIYDIYCTTENGEQFIVEMQNKQQINFRERALFYLSHAISRQGEKGASWRFNLKAVYGVFFMNFRLDDMPHKLRTDIVLSDRDTHEQFSDKLRFIFIELPSFMKEENECDTDFERWIYVLKNMETLNRMPFTARKSVFEKLEKIVDIASLSKEERIKYDESIKVYRDNLVTMEFAEQKGRAEGLVEGIERGLAQGLEKGRAEGKIEERRTIALQMKRMGMPVSSISEVTGLSQSEIDGL
ncbi:Rpn family recombination-promoting nuclease/putative transposase [uncultured Bacteroides sp.]|uniref:Rpn family recombination-promoting nuclease/putative transposase n=1 Tax=uncultured Bacteroides sp. TaxID=162156 RepID=UPI0025DDD307|nr:Rpn family recombination-promoting nuclease/putative transposase [uncultured Bacteroides sp.]